MGTTVSCGGGGEASSSLRETPGVGVASLGRMASPVGQVKVLVLQTCCQVSNAYLLLCLELSGNPWPLRSDQCYQLVCR